MELALKLFDMLWPLVGVAVTGWLSAKAAAWISSKTKNELLAGLLSRLNQLVWTCVRMAEQTLVKEIKKAKEPSSPGGSSLTKEEQKAIFDAVFQNVKELFGENALALLGHLLGLKQVELDKLIASKIEEMVASQPPLP